MRIHSYLSPKCKALSDSPIHRFGVFALTNISKGELIALWGGFAMTRKEVQNLPKEVLTYEYPVQIYPGFWIGPKKKSELDDCEMFNHSCDANAGVKGQIVLVARRNIKKGEEICFNYQTTDTQDLHFVCKCGAKNCRRKIDGQAWKNPKFQKEYQGYFSWYIQEKINKLRSKK